MSFNKDYKLIEKILEERKQQALLEAKKEKQEINKNTYELSKAEQKEIEGNWADYNAQETEEELSKHAYKLSEKEIERAVQNSKINN